MSDNSKYHNGQMPYNGQQSNSNLLSQGNSELGNQSDNELDLKQMFYKLWNRKWLVIGTMLFCGLVAWTLAFIMTPIYESDGTMLIEKPQSTTSLGGAEGLGKILSSSYGLGAGSTLANELQVLRSRKLSQAIADTIIQERLMPNRRQFPVLFRSYPSDSTMTSRDSIATRIRNHIVFEQVNREADVVSIIYESPAPYEASYLVNMAMTLYKNLSTEQNRISANSAVNFLEKEQIRIQQNLQEAEEELRVFMNSSDLVQVDAQTQELIKQVADLEARRQEARAKLVAVNSAIEQYRNQLSNIKPGLADQYAEAVGPNITRLQYAKSELEVEKEQLLTKNPNLKNSSPQITELNRKIDSYKRRIKELTEELLNESDQYLGFIGSSEGGVAQSISEINKELIELQVQQKQYQSQIDVVSAQLREQQNFFNNLPDNIIELAQLKRDVKINEEMFVAVSKQYAETALWEQTQFGLGRILDRGYVPIEPISPRPVFYILVGLILGAIFSVGYILIKEAVNTSIDGVEKMKKFNVPMLAVIPEMDNHIKNDHDGDEEVNVNGVKISSTLITFLNTISPISESYRRLENNLIYSNPDIKMKTIMVTSSAKGEGKTTTISNLGVVLAEAGFKTIIVDTDLRRPNLHNIFGLKKSPGFMEVLFDDVDILEATQDSIAPGLSILPAGRKPPNAAAITQSRAFLGMLKNLEEQFDFVLVDTPPFGIITDAAAMIRQADGVIVVARFNKTTEVQLSQTLEQLHRQKASVLGSVLTAFDHTESSDYRLGSSYYKEVYKDYNTYQQEV